MKFPNSHEFGYLGTHCLMHVQDATRSTGEDAHAAPAAVVNGAARLSLLDTLLNEQQSLTAVEHFAQVYQSNGTPAGAKYYRDLIPSAKPASGEQYAFEVDLDACSGCKACVAACHSLNGLEEDELWRSVGQLSGGTTQLPVIQHVTTACHHCVEPACLTGCPVEAYEKDPATGIVLHLDDQCIGCQYCMLKCPYDVPVYSKSKGIVRKCDMCHQRLAAGKAPACVQACPNQAIRIRIVNQEAILEASEANQFLATAPDAGYTAADDDLQIRAGVAAKPAAGRLLLRATRAWAFAARVHARADADVGRGVRGDAVDVFVLRAAGARDRPIGSSAVPTVRRWRWACSAWALRSFIWAGRCMPIGRFLACGRRG